MIRDSQSDFSKRTNAAMKEAQKMVVERARRHNTPIVVYRDGKIVELDPFAEELNSPEPTKPKTGDDPS